MGGHVPLVDKPVLDKLAAEVGAESAAYLLDSLKDEIISSGSKLTVHASSGDFDLLEVQAHALKSAVRSFGALRLGDACQAIEHAAKTESTPQLDGLLKDFQTISAETLEAFSAT